MSADTAIDALDSRVVATYQAPSTSLAATDAAVCIANDTP